MCAPAPTRSIGHEPAPFALIASRASSHERLAALHRLPQLVQDAACVELRREVEHRERPARERVVAP